MDKFKPRELLQAIKLDDLVLFSSLVKGHENVSFGRFPLLSVLYLYNAKKIIKHYEERFSRIIKYVTIEEDLEIYGKFKAVAHKALRLYQGEDSYVSPLEMLAILHRDGRVKKKHKLFPKSDTVNKNLKVIYLMGSQKFETLTTSVSITAKPLTKRELGLGRLALILVGVFIITLLSTFVTMITTTGLSTKANPFKIASVRQLERAIDDDGYYELTGDMEITSYEDRDIKCVLDGKGHTLTVSQIPSVSLFSKVSGTIKNVNIVYPKIETSVSGNFSLLCEENSGMIEGLKISSESLNIECEKSPAVYVFVSGITTTNNGTIDGCEVTLPTTISATGNGECSFSGIAGTNNGTISNCKFNKANVSANEVDATGIATSNAIGATIYNCINYADITETSAINSWSPTVSGVALSNYGKIDMGINLGSLSVISSNDTENAEGMAVVGGITGMNYGDIVKSLNKSELSVSTKNLMIYCGGISAYSGYYNDDNGTKVSTIIDSGVQGEISASSEGENTFVFAGGISGYLYGTIKNCYSVASIVGTNDDKKNFLGTALGSSYLQYSYFSQVICIEASNNYVLALDNVSYQIGSLITLNNMGSNSIVSTGLDTNNQEIISLATMEAIRGKEVYWTYEE